MTENENISAPSPDLFSTGPGKANRKPWIPMVIGLLLIVMGMGVLALLGRGKAAQTSGLNDFYIPKLQISGLHMEEAATFAGGKITYVEGRLNNGGDRKVTGASMEVLLKNSLNETVQKETQQVVVLLRATPYADYGSLDQSPLAPGQSREFRLTLEHVSADWDGQIPQVKIVKVTY
ncbi:MAG TPA: hypothetical protein VN176_03110 [Verrucomicrobiae bacterium]|jgi:hypothetical protein|nr:hypothetical protein [Verrucomicrobiae bacterium]